MDIVDQQTRSRMMAGIRGKNTTPELLVRRWLHRNGYRFRLHAKDLPGKPDLVLRKWNAAVFVHGCFWHRHENCKLASNPKSRVEFWNTKFEQNIVRDKASHTALVNDEWRVATVWECTLKKPIAGQTLEELCSWLRGDEQLFDSSSGWNDLVG